MERFLFDICVMRYLLFLIILSSQFDFVKAKVYTVDNTPGSGPDFTSLSAAFSGASAGDTLIVMPSATSYGSALTLSKKLFIYSRGHSNARIDSDLFARLDNQITLASTASGSVIMGLRLPHVHMLGAANCRLKYNLFGGGLRFSGGSNNNLVEGNIFSGFKFGSVTSGSTVEFDIAATSPASNNLLIHNYFVVHVTSGTSNGFSAGFVIGGNSTNVLQNNMFVEAQSGSGAISNGFWFFEKSSAQVLNNIIWSNANSRRRFQDGNISSVFKNNITFSAKNKPDTLPGFNYNDTMPKFVGGYNASNLPIWRLNNRMELDSGSVGKNGGLDSTDVGLFGQNYRFSFEGLVKEIPQFTEFFVLNPVVKRGGQIKVRVTGIKPD